MGMGLPNLGGFTSPAYNMYGGGYGAYPGYGAQQQPIQPTQSTPPPKPAESNYLSTPVVAGLGILGGTAALAVLGLFGKKAAKGIGKWHKNKANKAHAENKASSAPNPSKKEAVGAASSTPAAQQANASQPAASNAAEQTTPKRAQSLPANFQA